MSVRYKFDLFTLKGSDNEDSDQEREWEEQQIKKGVSLGSEVSSMGVNLGSSKAYLQCDNYTYLTNEIFGKICEGKFSVVRFV